MAEYTYKCTECGDVLVTNTLLDLENKIYRHVTLPKAQFIKDINDTSKTTETIYCSGYYERVYSPPNIIIKGKH